MAKMDTIFRTFLSHTIIDNYDINRNDLPKTVHEGLNSKHKIIQAIAMIVNTKNGPLDTTDNTLKKQLLTFLNQKQ